MARSKTNWLHYYYRIKKNRYMRGLSLAMIVIGGVMIVGWMIPAMVGLVAVPAAIDIFGFQLRIYTILVLLGMLAAIAAFDYLSDSYKPLQEVDPWAALVYVLVPGIILARAYYVLSEWDKFANNGIEFLRLDTGGLSIIGGFLGGLLGLYIYARRNKLDQAALLSAAAVVMPLAQAIGRFGNFFNRELFGFPTDAAWGMFVPILYRPLVFIQEAFFHPLFLYEAIPNLILFIGLIAYWKHLQQDKKQFEKAIKAGYFVRIYVVAYMTLRFILDFYRIDGGIRFYGFTVTQILYLLLLLLVLLIGLVYQVWFYEREGHWFTDHSQILDSKS